MKLHSGMCDRWEKNSAYEDFLVCSMALQACGINICSLVRVLSSLIDCNEAGLQFACRAATSSDTECLTDVFKKIDPLFGDE